MKTTHTNTADTHTPNPSPKTTPMKTTKKKTTIAPAKGHPMLGRRCVIRTYSAGVHIGKVTQVSPDRLGVLLTDATRQGEWRGGGLSLSAVANNGIKGGRINRTGEVYLTNVIEFIPTTAEAEATYPKFIED